MTRWAAGVEYDGTRYHGWQAQSGAQSIQATIECALTSVAGHRVFTAACGRTDAGVHALGQTIHFDSDARRDRRAWLLGGNSNLPPDISLRWIRKVADDFHARHSTLSRHYRYVLHNARARSSLLAGRAGWVARALDETSMNIAAQSFLGERDFSAVRAIQCQSKTAMRCVTSIRVWRTGTFVVMDVCANAFLHHMVRNMIGTLVEIGLGRQPVTWVEELLQLRDRRRAGATSPACGLYFIGANYPSDAGIPPAPKPWFPA